MKTLGKLILALFFIIIGSTIQAENLKETTKQFTLLMEQTTLSEVEFVAQLKPFIDPASNVDSICSDYYNHWKHCIEKNFFPLETKIEEIKKESKNTATVLISNIWHCDTGESYYFLSHTDWVKKENKWYRSTEEAKILASNKIEENGEN